MKTSSCLKYTYLSSNTFQCKQHQLQETRNVTKVIFSASIICSNSMPQFKLKVPIQRIRVQSSKSSIKDGRSGSCSSTAASSNQKSFLCQPETKSCIL